MDDSSSARDLVQSLLPLRRELPVALREQIVALGARAVPHLMNILVDARPEEGPGGKRADWNPYPPLHAATLLADLDVEDAMEPALRLLETYQTMEDREDDVVTALGDLAEELPRFGPRLLELALAAHARVGAQHQWLFTSVLARLGVRDDRIHAALVLELERAADAANDFAIYGDGAHEHLARAFDRIARRGERGFFDLREIHLAMTKAGCPLTLEQQKTWLRIKRDSDAAFPPLARSRERWMN